MADGLEQALELMRRARYSEAIERLRHGLSHDPDDAPMRALCGEAYYRSGNHERAFHHYNKAAASYLRAGDVAGSLKMLQLANALSPNEPDILFRMAECLKALGETREYEPILRQLIQVARAPGDRRRLWAIDELGARRPDDVQLAALRAEAMAETGRVAEAASLWRRLALHIPSLGIDFLTKATQMTALAPETVSVGLDVATTMLILERPREAIVLLAPYYEKFPEHLGILELLPSALAAIGATDKLIAARTELVKARTRSGQRAEGLQELAILLELAPENLEVLEVAAYAYAALESISEAIALWRKLANTYERLGRRAERDRAVLKVLKVDPDDEEALALGARALRENGRKAEARELEDRLAAIRRRRTSAAPRTPPSLVGRSIEPSQPAPESTMAAARRHSSLTVALGEADIERIEEAEDDTPTVEGKSIEGEPPLPPRAVEVHTIDGRRRRAEKEGPDPTEGLFLEEETRESDPPLPSLPGVAEIVSEILRTGAAEDAAGEPIEEVEEVTSRVIPPVSEEFLEAKAAAPTVLATNPPSVSWSRMADKASVQTLPPELDRRPPTRRAPPTHPDETASAGFGPAGPQAPALSEPRRPEVRESPTDSRTAEPSVPSPKRGGP